jgi:hypothetical protein
MGVARLRVRVWVVVALSVVLGACGGDEEEAAALTGGNRAPTITGSPGTSVNQGTAYTFTPAAGDEDGDALIFGIDAKPVWAIFDTATGRLSGTPSAADVGTYRGIVVWVSDGAMQTVLPAFDLTVMPPPSPNNRAPTISGTPATTVVMGAAYSFTPTASDPDNQPLTFSIRNRPGWAAFNTTTGRLQGTPPSPGSFAAIAISVSDGQIAVPLPDFTIVVTPPSVNQAPVISGTPMTSVEAGTAYTFVPTASDPEGGALTFAISGRPAWATFDTSTGRLSGTPPAGTTGTFANIVISVSDGASSAALPAFSIAVTAPTSNRPPTISGSPSTTATQGTAYSFQPTAADADGNALTFAIANRPTWATFNTGTGRLQGTPGASHIRTYSNIVISVSDGTASTPLPAFAITVSASNAAPTISGTPPTTSTVGTQYSFTPTGADADGDTLTYSIANRPTWATFTASTGRLQGTPTASNAGTFANVTISVSDGQASAQLAPFTIVVSAAPNRAPTISGTPPTAATVGTQFSFTPTGADADGDTLTYSIANRPTWATFTASTGRLQGTPTVSNVGTFANVTISVSDGQVSAQLAPFTIVVSAPPNRAPTISGNPGTAVMQDTLYSFTPTGSDADGDTLTYSINTTPAWASFDTATGRLSGTPGAQHVGATTGIVISVSDGALSASLAAFTVTVQAVATGSATLSWTAPTTNTDGSPLTNLAGYKIYWGPSAGNYPNSTTLNTAGVTSYVVTNLVPGTWFFVATALNSSGAESSFSSPASKTIP